MPASGPKRKSHLDLLFRMADPKGQWGLLLESFVILKKLSFTFGKKNYMHVNKISLVKICIAFTVWNKE